MTVLEELAAQTDWLARRAVAKRAGAKIILHVAAAARHLKAAQRGSGAVRLDRRGQ